MTCLLPAASIATNFHINQGQYFPHLSCILSNPDEYNCAAASQPCLGLYLDSSPAMRRPQFPCCLAYVPTRQSTHALPKWPCPITLSKLVAYNIPQLQYNIFQFRLDKILIVTTTFGHLSSYVQLRVTGHSRIQQVVGCIITASGLRYSENEILLK